jgi:thiol-disulfide isomerase/thioredoxin
MKSAICLAAIFLALNGLTACSRKGAGDDLAVAKIPRAQLQATNFLPLNDDKPGTSVDVQRYLVPGKYTIVFFFSRYDPTCQSLEPRLAQLSQVRPDLAVRTINVNRPEAQAVDWESPIVREWQISTLPYVQIYDPHQSLRAQGRPAYTQVTQWVQAMR